MEKEKKKKKPMSKEKVQTPFLRRHEIIFLLPFTLRKRSLVFIPRLIKNKQIDGVNMN